MHPPEPLERGDEPAQGEGERRTDHQLVAVAREIGKGVVDLGQRGQQAVGEPAARLGQAQPRSVSDRTG
jgi:hypothetical protein